MSAAGEAGVVVEGAPLPAPDDVLGDGVAEVLAVLGAGVLTPARALFAATDWAGTAIGPPSGWPDALRAAISTTMNTRFGMLVMAGPELVMVYNDAYAPMMGALHPAMGRPLPQVWADEWAALAPLVQAVQTEQVANHFEDFPLLTSRNGFVEEAYFTYSYSPLIDPSGGVVGVLNTVIETTGQVLATRRLRLAQQLGQIGAVRHLELGAAAAAVVDILAANRADLPAAAVYLLDDADDVRSPLTLRAGHGFPAVARTAVGVKQSWVREALTGGAPTVHDVGDAWEGTAVAPAEMGGGQVRSAVALPLTPPGRASPVGVLVLGSSPHVFQDAAYETFQALVANQVAGVLGDTLAYLTERAAVAASRSLAEALQRSLLTETVVTDDLQVVSRYLPAVVEAEIGGDWYDAFLSEDGAVWLVVGDVAGHDQTAAATMAQVRNLLRGIAYAVPRSPADLLAALDAAMTGLGVDVLTSAVVVRIETDVDAVGASQQVRWSNAGHPAPLLLRADGSVTPLAVGPERILGAVPGSTRTDHELQLQVGDSLLLYTDGLVERRTADLDQGQAWLVDFLTARQDQPLARLCEDLVAAVIDHADDDIALLALRVRGGVGGVGSPGVPGLSGGAL